MGKWGGKFVTRMMKLTAVDGGSGDGGESPRGRFHGRGRWGKTERKHQLLREVHEEASGSQLDHEGGGLLKRPSPPVNSAGGGTA